MTSGNEQLFADLRQIFAEALNMAVTSPDIDLIESGRLDSLGLVELLFEVEREFKVHIALEDLDIESFRSIRRIAEFIEAQRTGESAGSASS